MLMEMPQPPVMLSSLSPASTKGVGAAGSGTAQAPKAVTAAVAQVAALLRRWQSQRPSPQDPPLVWSEVG
jgi:hypothetical protein